MVWGPKGMHWRYRRPQGAASGKKTSRRPWTARINLECPGAVRMLGNLCSKESMVLKKETLG